MQLRLYSQLTDLKSDYGEIGKKVIINDKEFIVGDTYEIFIINGAGNGEICISTVTNREEDGKYGFFMGIGELRENEKIMRKIKGYKELKIGDVLNNLKVYRN